MSQDRTDIISWRSHYVFTVTARADLKSQLRSPSNFGCILHEVLAQHSLCCRDATAARVYCGLRRENHLLYTCLPACSTPSAAVAAPVAAMAQKERACSLQLPRKSLLRILMILVQPTATVILLHLPSVL